MTLDSRLYRAEILTLTDPHPWEKNCHRELTMSSRWAHGNHGGHGSGPNDHGSVTARRGHSSVTAMSQLSHGYVTAQSRGGHSSVTARSQLSHGEVTAQLRHLQYDHGSVTARSQPNHGPGHGSVTAGCDHLGRRELTVSSLRAHGELTVSSRWVVTVTNFFLMGMYRDRTWWHYSLLNIAIVLLIN